MEDALLEITIFHDGSVTNQKRVIPVVAEYETVQTGLKPGDYFRLTPDEFLLVGQDGSGNGVVQRLARDASDSLQITATTSLTGADLVGVAYDAATQWLYILDYTQKSILRAQWTGTGPLPQTFAAWAGLAGLPELANADRYQLSLTPELPQKPMLVDWLLLPSQTGYIIDEQAGSFSLSPLGSPTLLIDWSMAAAGQLTLRVAAEESVTVEVLSGSSVVGSATVPPGATAVDVPLAQPMAIGDVYQARPSGGGVEDRLVGVGRYGTPEGLSSGIQLRRIPLPKRPTIGNSEFRVALPVRETAPSGTRQLLGGIMGVAVLTDLPAQVVSWNLNKLLLADVFLSASGFVAENGQGFLSGRLPIPSIEDLVGEVVLVQFHVPDDSGGVLEIRRSEVFAFAVEGLSPAAGKGQDAFLRWMREMCSRGEAIYDPEFIEKLYDRRR